MNHKIAAVTGGAVVAVAGFGTILFLSTPATHHDADNLPNARPATPVPAMSGKPSPSISGPSRHHLADRPDKPPTTTEGTPNVSTYSVANDSAPHVIAYAMKSSPVMPTTTPTLGMRKGPSTGGPYSPQAPAMTTPVVHPSTAYPSSSPTTVTTTSPTPTITKTVPTTPPVTPGPIMSITNDPRPSSKPTVAHPAPSVSTSSATKSTATRAPHPIVTDTPKAVR